MYQDAPSFEDFCESLGFALTEDQKRFASQIQEIARYKTVALGRSTERTTIAALYVLSSMFRGPKSMTVVGFEHTREMEMFFRELVALTDNLPLEINQHLVTSKRRLRFKDDWRGKGIMGLVVTDKESLQGFSADLLTMVLVGGFEGHPFLKEAVRALTEASEGTLVIFDTQLE